MMHALKKQGVMLDIVERCNAVVVERIKDNVHAEANIALESFNNGGKRLRPILLVLAAKAPGAQPLEPIEDALIRLAGAVELVHLAPFFQYDFIVPVATPPPKISVGPKNGN